MRVAAPNIGRLSSICSSMRIRRGLRTQPFLSSSFHEGISIITTNRQSPIRMTAEQRGRISRCKGFHQGLVVHGMEGFDYDRARKELRIPDEFQVEAMAAVGRLGPKE